MRSPSLLHRLCLGFLFSSGVCLHAAPPDTSATTAVARARTNGHKPAIAFEPGTAFTGGGEFFARTPHYEVSLSGTRATFALGPASIAMTLGEAAPDTSLAPGDPLPGKVNYLLGPDRSKWRRNLPTYRRVVARDAWPGIDVAYYGNHDHVETDFVVAAGADPGRIALDFDGVSAVHPGGSGDLVLSTSGGHDLHLLQPVAYQRLADGTKVDVASHYTLEPLSADASYRVTFALGSYDVTRPLVIDPEVLVADYSTFVDDATDTLVSNAIAVDAHGNVFVAGNDPTARLAVVMKLRDDGEVWLFKTFVGATNELHHDGRGPQTVALAIALGGAGGEHAFVTGYTNDPGFVKTPQALWFGNPILRSGTAFVVKLSEDGSDLIYSSAFGDVGPGLDNFNVYTKDTIPPDVGTGIVVDPAGRAFIVGTTSHGNFPTTPTGVQPQQLSQDMSFLVELSADGTRLRYSTYIGAAGGGTYATGIALDHAGNVYVTGRTTARDFPMKHAFQDAIVRGEIAGFVMKLRPSFVFNVDGFIVTATRSFDLAYSTYLSGKDGRGFETDLNGIAVDAQGAMYVAGSTTEVTYPCSKHAFQCPYEHGEHSFTVPAGIVTKINPDGQSLAYSTFLGELSFINGIAERHGNAYVTGFTYNPEFPTRRAFQKHLNGNSFDAFATKLSDDGASLVWSTFVGGSGDDRGLGIAVGLDESAYITGSTTSPDFPMEHPLQNILSAPENGFIVKLHLEKQ
jgi:hypothetical protein